MSSISVLFFDHRVIRDNDTVADVDIAWLIETAKPEIGIQRVTKGSDWYERGILHANDEEVAVQRPLDRCRQPAQDVPPTLPDDTAPLTDAPERPQPQPA